MQAVILAAGVGSRLEDVINDRPKSFLEIHNETLIERSIRLLISQGISDIIIGTGYEDKYFEGLKPHYLQITTSRNADYRHTGSMFTLYLLKDLIKNHFLLLESDLLYERKALEYLLQDERENIILASEETRSGDEVFIQVTDQGHLADMSKSKIDLEEVSGELVGISKISPDTLTQMCSCAKESFRIGERQIHYEDSLVAISGKVRLWVKVVKDLAWCEIDDEKHLQRARELIYPKILQRD